MPKNLREAEGLVKRHPDGFGFFIPDQSDQPDVYIPRKFMTGVMSNDRVRVRVTPEPGGSRFRGEVIKIISRSTKRVMGQFSQTRPGAGVLYDRSFAWGEDIQVEDPNAMAKDGDLVAVQIEGYPDSPKGFWGKIISVLGDIEDPMNDSERMLHTHSIPYGFSKATQAEANGMPTEVLESEIKGRKDLRALKIVTIDGKTAKDFDDAVHAEKTETGFRLIVAIADVSHYVKPGSAIDEDAYARGTSTYFPNFVAPMLPEKLSNELCSLKPNVLRLALVAELKINFNGEIEKSEFYEAVIKSHARVTYGEAQDLIEGRGLDSLEHVKENILLCADLAKILMNKRFREGSLDLEIPETEIEVDETGQPVDILQSERLFSHRLIEELMLIANVAVARFFKEKNIPAIYRIHEPPLAEAMENFENFLKAFGFPKNLSGGHLQKKITKALEHFAGHPKEHILHILALRSLSQAKYSAQNVGHFGLGFQDYTHFTSPIRRYPDLIVHRLVKACLRIKGYQLPSEGDLETAGQVLSACEQRSVKAERQIRSVKKARFMAHRLGEEFDGVISSVTKFGIFVLLRQFDVDGLVRVEELGDDYFQFDEEALRLVGKKTGMCYEIGELVKVVVAKVDIEQGQIDFVLANLLEKSKGLNKSARRVHHEGHREQKRNDKKQRFGKQESKRKRNEKREPEKEVRGNKLVEALERLKKRRSGEKDSGRVRSSRLSKRRRSR